MYFSNEIVFQGHPDKLCDQIGDAILCACLDQDKNSRTGIEVSGGKSKIFVTGEITTKANIDIASIVFSVLDQVGVDHTGYEVVVDVCQQSPDIAMGVDLDAAGDTLGAGDQGVMFGYACNDTKECLPLAQVILQEFSRGYDKLRAEFPDKFYADGKCQITGDYYLTDGSHKVLKSIKTFICSYQNSEEDRIFTDDLLKSLLQNILSSYGLEMPKEIYFNPTGKFLVGSFQGDAGVLGRKIVVDAYQGFAPVGGGAFSGKDPTKVDRSAAYKARQLAIRALKEFDLGWCTVQLAYSIGMPKPLSIYVDSDKGFLSAPDSWYDECSVANIIKEFDLTNSEVLRDTAKCGHFTGSFIWER